MLLQKEPGKHEQNQNQSLCFVACASAAGLKTYAGVDVFQDLLDVAVLPDQVHGSLWADPFDGATVVTAEQNTQVYELGRTKKRRRGN